jgi:hypothetical protein
VGKEHDLFCYLSAPGVISEITELSSEPAGPAIAMR